jgi:hypothetical protein
MERPTTNFDVEKFIFEIDPINDYEIVPLPGGRLNQTVRAVQILTEEMFPPFFGTHTSLIVKHAPPYIAEQGADTHLSQNRQVSPTTRFFMHSCPTN